MNHQRTMERLAAARARGVQFGRTPIEKPKGYEEVRRTWDAGELSEREALRRLGVSRPTFTSGHMSKRQKIHRIPAA